MFVLTSWGVERVSLDGRERDVVFARPSGQSSVGTDMQWHVKDISSDYRIWALGDDDTQLFVGDATTGAVRQFEAVGNRASVASVSPDGKRLAVGRHSDFSLQGGKDDDTLSIVDVETLAFTRIEPSTDHWPATIEWAQDGSALWVMMYFTNPHSG